MQSKPFQNTIEDFGIGENNSFNIGISQKSIANCEIWATYDGGGGGLRKISHP